MRIYRHTRVSVIYDIIMYLKKNWKNVYVPIICDTTVGFFFYNSRFPWTSVIAVESHRNNTNYPERFEFMFYELKTIDDRQRVRRGHAQRAKYEHGRFIREIFKYYSYRTFYHV